MERGCGDILKALNQLIDSYQCLLDVHLPNPVEDMGYNKAMAHVISDLQEIVCDVQEGIQYNVKIIRMIAVMH